MDPIRLSLLVSVFLLIVAALWVISKKRLYYYVRPLLYFIIINCIGVIAIYIEISDYSRLWPFADILFFAYLSFMPFTWYQLASRWVRDDKEYSERKKLLPRLLFSAGAIVFVWLSWATGADISLIQNRWFIDIYDWRYLINANFMICMTAGTFALENRYRSSIGLAREKIKRSFLLLLAFAVNFLAMVTVSVLYAQISDWLITVNFILTALLSLTFGYHVIRFDPTNDGIILTRKASYSSMAAVIFGLYFMSIGIIGEILRRLSLDEGFFFSIVVFVLILIIIIIFFLSQLLKLRLKRLTNRGVGAATNSKYGIEWKEFADEISVTLDIDDVYSRTNRLLHRLMKIEDSFFIIKELESSANYKIFCGDISDRSLPQEKIKELCDWLYRYGLPVDAAGLNDMDGMEKSQFDALEKIIPFDIHLLIPFVGRQKFLGIWGVGRHISGRELLSDEIGFIEAASGPVALTILGARMTEELVISKEIESYHRFSSFVLHDLKNSVAMLSMLMKNAEKNIANPEFQKEALVTIGKAVARQKKIISRLTEEKGEVNLSMQERSLTELIEATLARVRIDTITAVKLKYDVNSKTKVYVDPEKIGSVFDNLIMNAVEAMPDGGSLIISSQIDLEEDIAVISFLDTGCGMDEDFINSRLFKPFSTTKKHGLGIGMYQSREIIMKHNGRLEVISQVGKGTEFKLYLPGELKDG